MVPTTRGLSRTVRDLDDDYLAIVHVDDLDGHRERWLCGVRDQCLQPKRVGAAALVPGPRTCDAAVVLDADEEDAAEPVGQAYDGFDQVAVVEALTFLALELDVVPLAAGSPLRHLRPHVVRRRGGAAHAITPCVIVMNNCTARVRMCS